MSDQEDISCIQPDINIVNPAVLPTLTSTKDFDFNAFVAELSGLEDLQGEETLFLYEPPFPSIEEVSQAEKDVFSNSGGDSRFTAEDVYNFVFSRYRPIDNSDSFASQSSIITLTGCTFDGDIYTYTIPGSSTNYIKDTNNKEVLLPIYDSFNQKVTLPITDINGKYLLVESTTGIDAANKIVHFPLKDNRDNILKYPFKGFDGNVITHLPAQNNKLLNNVDEAYEDLDLAYEKAKDANAFEFVEYLLDLDLDHKLGFFYGTITLPASSYFFTVGVYKLSATDDNLVDITNSNLEYFLRYYPDRAQYVFDLYKSLGGSGIWTNIIPPTSTDIAEIIKYEKQKLASFASLSVPYWTVEESNTVTYEDNVINSSPIHTSMSEIYTLTTSNSSATTSLQNRVISLETQLSSLSTQFISLFNMVSTLSTNVAYNSAIIDTLADPLNWGNIWFDKPTGYSRPIDPLPRT